MQHKTNKKNTVSSPAACHCYQTSFNPFAVNQSLSLYVSAVPVLVANTNDWWILRFQILPNPDTSTISYPFSRYRWYQSYNISWYRQCWWPRLLMLTILIL